MMPVLIFCLVMSLQMSLLLGESKSAELNKIPQGARMKVDRMIGSYSKHFTKGQRAPSSHLHTVVFAIEKLRMEELRVKLEDISDPFSANYGKHMTRTQIANMTSNFEGRSKLVHYLENHPHRPNEVVKVLKATPYGDFVFAQASVKLWESFFNTEFFLFHKKNPTRPTEKNPIVRSMEYSLPVEIAAHVLGVFNVSDVPPPPRSGVKVGDTKPSDELLKAAKSSSSGGTIVPNYVTPALLNKVYSIDSNIGSSRVSQGVYETSIEYYSPSDLSAFQSYMGLSQETVAVDIGGHQDNNACYIGDCGEGNLDVQYMMGVSQVTPTTYYYINETNFILDWLVAVASMASPPLVLSVSWGSPDSYISSSYMTAMNYQAMILSAMGVTLIAASGDDGALGYFDCTYTTYYPASSPYFTTVGATNGPQKGLPEVACQRNKNGGTITSGGGISNLTDTIPYWQANAVQNYFSTVSTKPASGYATTGRGYPDVSLLGADYIIFAGGATETLFGTSASAPVFGAMVSLVNAARQAIGKPSLGWINPALYSLSHKFINDITSGDNTCSVEFCCTNGFYAAPGWDPVTGLGSVNFTSFKAAFLDILSGSVTAPVPNPTAAPTTPTKIPSAIPTKPTRSPTTSTPIVRPSIAPSTIAPTRPTAQPSKASPEQCFALVNPKGAPNSNAANSPLFINGVRANTAYGLVGATVSVEFDYDWQYDGYCYGCITQMYTGFRGSEGACGGNFLSGVGPTSNPLALTFSSQLVPGCNLIFATFEYWYYCDEFGPVTDGTFVGAVWAGPTNAITSIPSNKPSKPTTVFHSPTRYPTVTPSTRKPKAPTATPTQYPTKRTRRPTIHPSATPSMSTIKPTVHRPTK